MTEQAIEHSDAGTDTGTFDTVAAAVAELDRREQARKAERKAAKAEKAEPTDDDKSDPTEDDDHDPRKVQKDKTEPKDKEPKKEPKPKAKEESEEDDSDPDDDAVTPDDDEDGEPEEPKQKQQAKPPLDDDTEEVEHEGKTYRVPKDLKDSFLRQSDYTRKTQEVAQERQVLHQTYAQASQAIAQAQTVQQTLTQYAQAMLGSPPPLELAEVNLGEYVRQKEHYEQRRQMLAEIAQQGEATKAEQARLMEIQRSEARNQNLAKLYQAAPELKNDSHRQQFAQIASTYLQQFGFDPSELMAVEDSRTLLMVRRLLHVEYQLAQHNKTAGDVSKRLANVPTKTLKPGAADAQGEKRRSTEDAKRRFARSAKSMKDVEAFLKATSR